MHKPTPWPLSRGSLWTHFSETCRFPKSPRLAFPCLPDSLSHLNSLNPVGKESLLQHGVLSFEWSTFPNRSSYLFPNGSTPVS